MKSLGTAVVALALASAAWADDELPRKLNDGDREARLLELEARVRTLEAQQSDEETIRKLREAAGQEKKQEAEELPGRVSKIEKQMASAGQTWDASKMLTFATADGNFTAKIGGRIYFTWLHIFDRDDGSGGTPDTFNLDTARVMLDGTFFKSFYYRVEYEAQSQAQTQTVDVDEGAGTSNVSITSARGTARMKDIYIGWNAIPDYLSIQGGQMKMPWSQEETCSSRFIDFGERSILNRLAPAHNAGVMAKGFLADKIFEWNLGVFNTALSRDAGRNAPDPSDEKMVAARLFISPFVTQNNALKQLRLGVDAFVGDIDGGVAQPDLSTGDLGGVAFADFNGTAALDGMRKAYLVNFHWGYGPFALRAEYGMINQELLDGTAESDFDITGYYVQATWLLTGEDKPLENRVKPKNNLDPANGGWGAFELAARLAMVKVADEAIDAGIMAAGENQDTQEIAVGLNWWWAPNVALRLTYHMFSFDEDLTPAIGTGDSLEDKQDVFYVRWQIDF